MWRIVRWFQFMHYTLAASIPCCGPPGPRAVDCWSAINTPGTVKWDSLCFPGSNELNNNANYNGYITLVKFIHTVSVLLYHCLALIRMNMHTHYPMKIPGFHRFSTLLSKSSDEARGFSSGKLVGGIGRFFDSRRFHFVIIDWPSAIDQGMTLNILVEGVFRKTDL